MNDTKFVSIFHPHDSIQAGLVGSALKQAGIICYVNNENLSAIHMGSVGIGACGMTVMIPDNRIDEANEIIRGLGLK